MNLKSQYSQIRAQVKFAHPVFSLRGRVMLNKLWVETVQGQTGYPSKYFSFSMYCVGDMDGCLKVAIFLQ